MKETSAQIDRVELEPFLGWLLRSRVRVLALYEHGILIERGNGTRFASWDAVQVLMSGIVDRVSRKTGAVESSRGSFHFTLVSGETIQLPSALAIAHGERLAAVIVEKAGLKWVHTGTSRLGGFPLPAIAVKPASASAPLAADR